jgi:phospholipid transport system substrate-binding protein
MSVRHLAGILFGAAVVVLVAAPAVRAAQPMAELRERVDQVIKILQDPQLKKPEKDAERRAAVRRVANDIFDYQETARRALGRHWQARTPEEQKEFVQLFTDLLEHSYLSKIEQYQGEKVSYLSDTVEGDHATVKTKIVTPKGTEVPIDYRMVREGDRWRVYDVLIEGVSLVGNYRTQFNKIIQTGSFKELMDKMRAKAFSAPGADKEPAASGREKS